MMPTIRRFAAAAACLFAAGAVHAAANVRITEFMYKSDANRGVGEYVEFSNLGDSAQDMTGWSFDDNHRIAGSTDLSSIGTLQPGESAILTELDAADFRTRWNLCDRSEDRRQQRQQPRRQRRDQSVQRHHLVDRLTYDAAQSQHHRVQRHSAVGRRTRRQRHRAMETVQQRRRGRLVRLQRRRHRQPRQEHAHQQRTCRLCGPERAHHRIYVQQTRFPAAKASSSNSPTSAPPRRT